MVTNQIGTNNLASFGHIKADRMSPHLSQTGEGKVTMQGYT